MSLATLIFSINVMAIETGEKIDIFNLTEKTKTDIGDNAVDAKYANTTVATFDLSTEQGCKQYKNFLLTMPKNNTKNELINDSDPCEYTNGQSKISFLFMNKNRKRDLSNSGEGIDLTDLLAGNSGRRGIVSDTLQLSIVGAGVIGSIALMPESISNWNEEKIGYVKNMKKGFHMDEDSWYINYVGHSYSGALYYAVARHNGLSEFESFGYSCLMSTFYWELGLEGYFEQPSIQDLIITPIIGSILGYAFEKTANMIKKNEGEILGSKLAGNIALLVLDPINPLIESNTKLGKKLKKMGVRTKFVIMDPAESYNLMYNHKTGSRDGLKPAVWTGLKFEYPF